MKTINLLALGFILLWNPAAVAGAPTQVSGSPIVSISGAGQNLDYQLVSAKTNIVNSKMNDTLVSSSTVTNFSITADTLLEQLANSFNTNFPTGAKLLLSGLRGRYTFAVSDSTGTNVFLQVDSVLPSGELLSSVNAGLQTLSTTNQIAFTGNDTEAYTVAITFTYDDTAMATGDGTHSSFSLNCLAQIKESQSLGTGADTENVTMNLTGGGRWRGQPDAIFTGTVQATLTGIVPFTN